MKTFAQCLDLVDDPASIAEYEAWHRRVFPEVLAGLRAIGVRSMRIFRHGARLFMTFEADDAFDPALDYPRYAENAKCREWDAMMRKFQRPVPGAKSGEWWSAMHEVFRMERAP